MNNQNNKKIIDAKYLKKQSSSNKMKDAIDYFSKRESIIKDRIDNDIRINNNVKPTR